MLEPQLHHHTSQGYTRHDRHTREGAQTGERNAYPGWHEFHRNLQAVEQDFGFETVDHNKTYPQRIEALEAHVGIRPGATEDMFTRICKAHKAHRDQTAEANGESTPQLLSLLEHGCCFRPDSARGKTERQRLETLEAHLGIATPPPHYSVQHRIMGIKDECDRRRAQRNQHADGQAPRARPAVVTDARTNGGCTASASISQVHTARAARDPGAQHGQTRARARRGTLAHVDSGRNARAEHETSLQNVRSRHDTSLLNDTALRGDGHGSATHRQRKLLWSARY